MVNKADFIVNSEGRKLYRMTCDSCDGDRGYHRSRDEKRLCTSCVRKTVGCGHLFSKKVRQKASNSNTKYDYWNVNKNDFISYRSGVLAYRTLCINCNVDKGYHTLVNARKPCRQCYRNDKLSTRVPDIHRHIKACIKSNLYHRLKYRGIIKIKPTFKMLPYTVDELKSHLESLFKPGMTWDNYGEWEIDHVTPDSWFKYNSSDDEGFKRSWALDNLQPLWWRDNLKKSNKHKG